MNKWIRSFIFLLFALTTQWVQAQSVAKVGTTEYATIEEAVEAWGPGKTLTLLANVTTTSTVTVEVNATKSSQNWTLDLGDYTWTASGCNAFKLYAAGGTVMNQNYGLKIYANQNGGITASGKYCIECTYDNSKTRYRPRLEIHGGTYNGSNIIYYYSSSWANSNIENGPSTHIFKSNDGTEPVFNGNFGLYKCPITIYAGYFNGTSFNSYPVSSTADTNLNGGHFKTISAFPSASNNKGIIFGNYKVFVNSDASIDVINGAPATYEAKATKTLLLSAYQSVNYSDYVYYEKANDAINKYSSGTIEIILNNNVTATQNKSFRSGTLTIDASAEGSDYTGSITLTSTSAKFIIKFPEGKGHYGVTASTGRLHVTESVADGIVTRTYSVQNVSNPEAQVGSINYSTVYDAFYAIDGTTTNQTIKLLKDVTNAGIVTNGTAVNAEGKTVATFDLNGKSIGIGSVAAGNNADYTLTIIDSSTDKTGTVTNSDASLFLLALTGINDYSGTYTLKIQAGTWMFDPSNVTVNGETYNMVDVGYVAHDNGNGTWTVGEKPMVAQIGTQKYETIDAAVAAANEGETIEVIAAGDYTLPSLPKNVTIEGKADGEVSFTHTTAGNIAGVPNGATFKNITINWGNVNYHGFQHAGTINMEGCTLNGKFFSYGDMNFTSCEFNQSNSDYHMWAYSGDLTYTDCTFTNEATGKFINVYNEDGTTKYTVTATNCKFINNASSPNKAALNIKATSGSNLLAYDVIINNCSTEGSFPEASSSAALVVLNSLAQVDDRTASGVDNITVTQDGVLIYPATVAAIGETRYPTLQSAVNAAQQMGGEVTVNIIDDISGETVTINEVANFKLTIDGKKDESSNYTVDAVIVVDGLRGNGGSTTNGASVTLQNIAFVKTTATDGIQASHYPHHLTIQNCTYTGFDSDKWFLNASVDGPLYGVTVKDVTVENARLIYANMAEDAVFENITATNNVKVGFNVKTSGTALIKDCQITTGKYAFRDYSDAYEGTFTLEGNTFISTSEDSDEGAIVNRGGAVGTAHINVESGTYTGHLKVLNNKEGVLALSGGYFSEEFPQEYIAEELVAQGKVCAPATDMEGYYTIGDPHYVAQIGETKYVSLAEAVAVAQANDVITMIDDDNLSLTAAGSEVTINKPLTITGPVDENGKPKFTIFGSTNGALDNNSFNDLFLSCSTGTVTISNVKFEGFGNEISSVMGHSPVFIGSHNQNAVIENVYISNLNCEGIHINGGTFTINDCNIDCSKTTNTIFTKGICVVNDAEGTIENTTITGVNCEDPNDTSAAIELQGSGNVAINSCTIQSNTIGIATTPVGELTAGTSQVTVSNCTVESHNIAVFSDGEKGALTSISSGRYSGLLMAGDNDEGLSISGGVFDDLPEQAYCAEGYAPADNPDVATNETYPYTVLELPDVAQIGDVKYKTLQKALDAAYNMTGDVTIELIADISGYSIVHQKAGVNITIDGKDQTIAGQILVEGDGRASGTETLTIQNVKFEGNTSDFISGTDAFVLIPSTKTEGTPYYTGKYNYAHNITVKDCSFTSTSAASAFNVVGVKATSNAGCYNMVISNTTGTNLHSLAQLTGTTGGTIENNTVSSSESFVNISGGAGSFNVSGNIFTSAQDADGYGIRENGSSSATINLSANDFTAASAIVLGKKTDVPTGTINVESGVYTGAITKTEAATGKIAISGGYFSEEFPQEYIAEDLVADGYTCILATDKENYFTVGIPHYVAQIGDTKYVSLEAAVNAVPADGTETTIVMIDNETIIGNAGVTIPVGKNVVLDLNGKTVKGVVENPANAQTILNKGTLTITDNSDEKNGTITNEVSDENAGSPGNNKNWFSNAITNTGVLTVNEGNIDNTGTGGACYAIDNQTNGNLQTPVLNIAGGNITAKKVAVRMFCNSTTNVNTVNVTGGKITSENAYALQAQQANKNANKAALNIAGGTLTGQYAFADHGDKNTATQFDNATYNITGGFFSGYMWSYATYYCGMEGFVSGGYFDNEVGGDIVAPGKACVDNTEEETMEAYPYTIGLADIHYYWLDNNGNIDGGGYYTIYAPFAGPDPVLMDGEFVELQKDITLTKDIEYIEEVSFGDPIFKGGTFTLTFGEYSIDLNGHAFPIPTGVTILTDKQTDIFSALEEGYKVVEETTETGYAYSVVQKEYVAQIGEVKYETLQDALDAAYNMTGDVTIELIADISGYSIVHQKAGVNITIDGKDQTIAGQILVEGDGRASGTETLTIQNVKFEGNTSDFISGTDAFVLIPSTKTEGTPYYTGKYNYAHNITVKDCSFTSTAAASAFNVVGVKATSNAGCYNMVISNTTGTNLHSLAQLTGTTGGTIENNTVSSSESFVNINGGAGSFNVSGNIFTSAQDADGYGIRENGSSSATINLSANDFTAASAIVLGKKNDVPTGTIKVESGVYTGAITKTEAANGKIAISGGYFSEEFPQEFIAENLVAQGYVCIPATDKPGYFTVGTVPASSLIVFHDSGTYEKTFEVPMFTRMTGADIYYRVNGGDAKKYTGPVSIEEDTELIAWMQIGNNVVGDPITKNFTIQARPTYDINKDGYFYVKNGDKYVNVAGRKTVTLVDQDKAEKAAGAVIRLVADNDTVKTLRSQAVDLPGYAKRAMNYVPEMVQLIVKKLHADGGGNILGANGLDAIMTKFNESFDYNLYLEEAGDGYRIYGRTPSMKPVVDFYYENKVNVDAKLPELESFINNAIDKLKTKLNGRGDKILKPFSVHAVWQEMGGTLTEPVDAESTACFYEEVLASEANVWSFAYETAMMYYEPLMASETFQGIIDQLGDYKKYLDKLPQVRPNFKYYIVADGNKVNFVSEGNDAITNNESNAIWTLEERTDFTVAFEEENMLVDGLGTKYYTTLYTDFAYTMPENAKAYYVTGYNTKGVAELEEINGVIPAQTPVLLMTQDKNLEATVTLSTEAGTAPETNLLKGADWIVNEKNLQTMQLQALFAAIIQALGADFYTTYMAKYEHLLMLNAGTVNNKYFFGLKDSYIEDVDNMRQLCRNTEGKLGFWENFSALPANKAFLIEEQNPVLIPLWPDVNCDGKINVGDVTAIVDIILNNQDAPLDTYDYKIADLTSDAKINIHDVTTMVDIILGIYNPNN